MTKLQKETIKNWIKSSDKDRKTAYDIFKLKHYSWSLFMYHLAIEKLLKVQLLKNNQRIPHTHKLLKLARLAKIKLTEKEEKQLVIITDFNISARYDIDKMKFYKIANKEYTKHWFEICDQIYEWVKGLL